MTRYQEPEPGNRLRALFSTFCAIPDRTALTIVFLAS